VVRVLLFLFLLFLLAIFGVATTQGYYMGLKNSGAPLPTLDLIEGASEQVLRGAELYDWNCSVCHGPTALGFEEARAEFPESHRQCESCHRKNNPDTRANFAGNTNERNAFSIGVAPSLRGEASLSKFTNGAVLYAYIYGAMPRYEPGRLTLEESLDITAFLLHLRGVRLEENLTEASATTISVTP
jgi:cytochrome c